MPVRGRSPLPSSSSSSGSMASDKWNRDARGKGKGRMGRVGGEVKEMEEVEVGTTEEEMLAVIDWVGFGHGKAWFRFGDGSEVEGGRVVEKRGLSK